MPPPEPAPPSRLRKVLLGTAPIQVSALSWRRPIVVAIVTTVLVALAIALGDPIASFSLAVGALFTGLGGINEAPGHRWRIMLWTGMWVSLSAIAGGLMSNIGAAELAVVAIVAAGCGFAGAIGARALLVGVLTLVVFAIYSGIPDNPKGVLEEGALVGLGAVIQMVALLVPVLVRNRGVLRGREEHLPSIRARLRSLDEHRDDFRRHGLRLAIAMTVATAIGHVSGWPHQYWIPMTVAWLSRPDTSGLATRVLSRVAGTLIGTAVAIAVIDGLGVSGYGLAVVVGLGAILLLVYISADYTIAVTGITVVVLSLFSITGEPIGSTAPSRIASTIVAAAIVVVAAAAWPSRSSRHAVFD